MPLLKTITTPYAEAFLQLSEAAGDTDEVVAQARELGIPLLSADSKIRSYGHVRSLW